MRSCHGLRLCAHGIGLRENYRSGDRIATRRSGASRRWSAGNFRPRQPSRDGRFCCGVKANQNLATDFTGDPRYCQTEEKASPSLRFALVGMTEVFVIEIDCHPASRFSSRVLALAAPDLGSGSRQTHAGQSPASRHPSASCRMPRRDPSQ